MKKEEKGLNNANNHYSNNNHQSIDNHQIIELIVDHDVKPLINNLLSQAKHEIIIAIGSIDYLTYFYRIGCMDSLGYAHSKGVNTMILSSIEELNLEEEKWRKKEKEEYYFELNEKENQYKKQKSIFSFIKKYTKFKRISGLNELIIITDNSQVLMLKRKEDIKNNNTNIIGFYSVCKSIVNNYGSLLEVLWNEQETLESIIKLKDNLTDANKRLVEVNNQLNNINKLQREFIDTASHELRTPVHAILGYLELMIASPGSYEHYIDYIAKNADRLEKLIVDLLDVRRIESNNMILYKEKIDIYEIVSEVVEDIKPGKIDNLKLDKDNNKKVKITIVPDKKNDGENKENAYSLQSHFYTLADRMKIHQVISNLINNSLKSIYDKDKNYDHDDSIIITLTKKKYTEEKQREYYKKQETVDTPIFAHNAANSKNGMVIVSIKDTGKGIDPSRKNRLFEKFATNFSSGTGLGLYISKNIIEAHGGMIWAENNRNAIGATFSFTLPLIDYYRISDSSIQF